MESNFSINDSMPLTKNQERMRRDLRYYFMNPKEKWQAKGTIPFKLVVIVIKIIFITLQLIIFSEYSVNEVKFFEGSKTSFKHLFLENWDSSFETPVYPPSHGYFAVYKINEFYSSLTYALKNYYKMSEEAIGPYGFGNDNVPECRLCFWHYNISEIYTANRTFHYSDAVVHRCLTLAPVTYPNGSLDFEVYDILKKNGIEINFNGLLRAKMDLKLRSIQLKSFEMNQIPNCYQFDIVINYDNSNHNGQLLVDLDLSHKHLECNGTFDSKPKRSSQMISLVLDIFSFLFCLISFVLCLRSSTRQYRFWQRVKLFFDEEIGVDVRNKWEHFMKYSYLLILFADMFSMIGSGLKLPFYSFNLHSDYKLSSYNLVACSYSLGLGLFLSYCTILRYFSYFRKSSVLMKTMSYSARPLLSFSFCSAILYLAFSLFGWIILGPYHIKFRTFPSTVACLFSLMNGDDMFTTLSIINHDNDFIYAFSQIFIYIFVMLFIFVVLNLILTIIIEAYDQVKQGDDILRSQHDLFWNFVNSCPATAKSSEYRDDKLYDRSMSSQHKQRMVARLLNILCCCIGDGSHTRELQPILTIPNDLNGQTDCPTAELHSDFYSHQEDCPPARPGNIVSTYPNPCPYRYRNYSDITPRFQSTLPHHHHHYRGGGIIQSRSARHRIRNLRRRYGKHIYTGSFAEGNGNPAYLTRCEENGDLCVTHTHPHTHRFRNMNINAAEDENGHDHDQNQNNLDRLNSLFHQQTRPSTMYNRYTGDYGSFARHNQIRTSNSNENLERDNSGFSSSGSSENIFQKAGSDDKRRQDKFDDRVRSL